LPNKYELLWNRALKNERVNCTAELPDVKRSAYWQFMGNQTLNPTTPFCGQATDVLSCASKKQGHI